MILLIKILFSLLEYPLWYKISQKVFNKNNLYKILAQEYLQLKGSESILDIGCGTANVLDVFREKITYVGFDSNLKYIKYAIKNTIQSKHTVKLFNQMIETATVTKFGAFDFVIAVGVLHHLDDNAALDLFKIAFDALKPRGKLITIDPTWNISNSWISKFLTSYDRGQYIRDSKQYKVLGQQVFKKISMNIREDLIRVSQSNCILVCEKR